LKFMRYCDYSIVLPLFFPLKKSNIIYVYSRRWRHPFKFITRSLGTYSSYCHGSVVLPRKQGFPTHVYQPTERTNDIIRSYPLTHDPHHSVELASSSPPSFSLSLNLVHYKALCSRSVAPKSAKKHQKVRLGLAGSAVSWYFATCASKAHPRIVPSEPQRGNTESMHEINSQKALTPTARKHKRDMLARVGIDIDM